MRPVPKCVLDRSRPCNACIAPDPRHCPYPYLLAGDKESPTGDEGNGAVGTDGRTEGSAHAEG